MEKFLRVGGLLLVVIAGVVRGFSSGALRLEARAENLEIWNSGENSSGWRVENLVLNTGFLVVSPRGGDSWFFEFLRGAEEEIQMQIYDFTNQKIREALAAEAAEGVEISLQQEERKFRQFRDTFSQVTEFFSGVTGVVVESDAPIGINFLHSKVVVVDDEKFSVQTANFTKSAFQNREHFFVGENPEIAENLGEILDADLVGGEIPEIHPNLAVCPLNCREIYETLLAGARESIVIQAQYISDERIRRILLEQRDAGVEIRVILPDFGSNRAFQSFFGREFVRILGKPYVHSKVMLIDGRRLVIGSVNFSQNSLDRNREVSVISMDPRAIVIFEEFFGRDRRMAE